MLRSMKTLPFVVVALVCLASGCKKTPPPATSLPYDQACTDALNGKRISTEGYLAVFSSTKCGDDGCGLIFNGKPPGGGILGNMMVTVPQGGDTNEMAKLPAKFSDSDVKVHTPKGDVGMATKVRVAGTITSVTHGDLYDSKGNKYDGTHCQLADPTFEPI